MKVISALQKSDFNRDNPLQSFSVKQDSASAVEICFQENLSSPGLRGMSARD
jgi:hypothetical protein